VTERTKQTIGCLVLIVVGLALAAAGIAAGASVDWQLVDSVISYARRSAPAIVLVPMMVIVGVAATVLGAVVIRMPASRARCERENQCE